jgi:hypothetical protein
MYSIVVFRDSHNITHLVSILYYTKQQGKKQQAKSFKDAPVRTQFSSSCVKNARAPATSFFSYFSFCTARIIIRTDNTL